MTNYVVTSTGGGIAVDGQITLLEALTAATSDAAAGDAAATGNDTITFAAALSGSTIDIFATSAITAGNLTINGDSDGDGTRDITINHAAPPFSDQATQEQHFNVSASATLNLTDITISGGSVFFAPAGSPNPGSGLGGAVENAGTLSLDGAAFQGNSATSGGAIYNTGTVTGTDAVFSNNTAIGSNADEGGGAIYNDGGTVNLTGGSLSNNTASGVAGSGGAIFTSGGSVTLTAGVDFAMNSANRQGGAIENAGGAISSGASVFIGNTAGNNLGNGGAIHSFSPGASLNLVGNFFQSNMAAGDGGGVWIGEGTTARVTAGDFSINSAAEGGAIYVSDGGDLTVMGVSFFTNVATDGASAGQAVGSGDAPGNTGNIELLSPVLLGTQSVVGGSQDDVLEGDAAANIMIGNAGNDVFRGEGGADTMTGGTGNDVYAVDDAGDVVVEAAGEGADAVYASTTFTLPVNVEALILTVEGTGTGNGLGNYLIGLEDDNTLNGEGGNDVLIGNGGEDALNGGAGQDILDGGAGADMMAGGADNDIYLVTEAGDVVIELAGEGNDAVYSQIDGYTMTAGVETLIMQSGISARGSAEANSIYGNDEDNRIDGGAGLDILYGFGGEDTFIFMAADQGPLIEQEIIVNFEGAGVAGGDRLEFDGFDEGSTLVQVSSLSYQVRDAENAVTAQFWLYEGQGVLNADDYAFV